MKKVVLSAFALLLAAAGAQAQIAPGTIYLGGSANFSHQTNKADISPSNTTQVTTSTQSGFGVQPTVGYFVAENLMLGLGFGYNYSKTEYPLYNVPINGGAPQQFNTRTGKSRGYNVGPLVRYYKFVGEHAAFFGHLGTAYQTAKATTDDPLNTAAGLEQQSKGYFVQLAPGFAYFPSNKFGLEISMRGLAYDYQETKSFYPNGRQESESSSRQLTLGFGLSSLQLGAAFYLGRD